MNAHYGYREDAEFTIKAGEISTHTVTLPEGSLRINTEPGAEIFVEGELDGIAPLGRPVPIGAREVLVRHPIRRTASSVDVVLGARRIERDSGRNRPAPTPPRLPPLSMPPERRPLR